VSDEPTERACEILRRQYYMVVGTTEPWSAAVAYTPVPPNRLYFTSKHATRHCQAIAADPRVSGVIFDSRAKTNVDSLQFAGTCRDISDDAAEVRAMLSAGARVVFVDAEPADAEVRAITDDPTIGIYRVDVEEAYVRDQAAYAGTREDLRLPIHFETAMTMLWDVHYPAGSAGSSS